MYGERDTDLKKDKSGLARQLLFLIVVAFITGAMLFAGLLRVFQFALDRQLFQESAVIEREQRTAEELQNFVDDAALGLSELQFLDVWAENNRDVFITLYTDAGPVYSSDSSIEVQILEGSDEITLGTATYPIRFADGTAYMIPYFVYNRYYTAASVLAALLAALVAFVILMVFIRRKLRYIRSLENDLRILAGGDLSYAVTIRGNDELTSLGQEIETMRKALLERQESEQTALRANRDLVTSISHDLRTPLTVLSGYLDILRLDKDFTPTQQKYLDAAAGKATQIKTLSDELFDYFLVAEKDDYTFSPQPVEAEVFVKETLEPSLFDLQSAGFTVERDFETLEGTLMPDRRMMRRVFSNLVSNIGKYGDPAHPVHIEIRRNETDCLFRFVNYIKEPRPEEGTGMGLRTCAQILKHHNGAFETYTNGNFTAEVWLPIRNKK